MIAQLILHSTTAGATAIEKTPCDIFQQPNTLQILLAALVGHSTDR